MNDKTPKSPESGWPKSHGMTVPEGYFDDFQRRMMERIPAEVPAPAPVVLPRSFWQRVRPYVYMAAMFAGIWLMMNIFTFTGGGSQAPRAASNSALLADVVNSSTTTYVDEYVSMSDYDLYDELYEAGFEIPE